MDEKTYDQIQFGKMAEALWPQFSPVLIKKKNEAIQRLKELYQSKLTDSSLYVAQVAVIAALDEIIMDFERKIKNSRIKEKEILDGN